MEPRNIISAELKSLGSSLPAAEHGTYQVPLGYFSGLADHILRRIKAMETTSAAEELAILSPLLSQATRANPYSVPAGYFESLDASFAISIDDSSELEIAELSPLLSGLKKQQTFAVPEGYFEGLIPNIEESQSKPAKVVSIGRKTWLRYAAAAVVIGFVTIAGFMFLNKNGDEKIDPATKSFAWVEKNLKKVSTDDIDQFVEQTVEESPVIAKVDAPEEIKNLLKDVSEKEINEFLNDAQSTESDTDELLLN